MTCVRKGLFGTPVLAQNFAIALIQFISSLVFLAFAIDMLRSPNSYISTSDTILNGTTKAVSDPPTESTAINRTSEGDIEVLKMVDTVGENAVMLLVGSGFSVMASIALFIGLINLSLKLMEVWIGINCFNISAGAVIFLVRVSGSRATWAVGPPRALGALLYLGLNLYFVCSVVALTRTVKRRKHLQKQILMSESTGCVSEVSSIESRGSHSRSVGGGMELSQLEQEIGGHNELRSNNNLATLAEESSDDDEFILYIDQRSESQRVNRD